MTLNPFASELAAEHRQNLLRDAEAYRRARAARPARRHTRAALFTLRVRPIRPDDSASLIDLFDRLSADSRWARFLYGKKALTPGELRLFTNVDHHDHEALVAVTRFRGAIVGLAQYVRNRDDATSADVALVVADEWQDIGLGSMLASRLAARALCEGVTHFTALMASGNDRARRLLAKAGNAAVVGRDNGTVSYRVALSGYADVPGQRRTATLAEAGCR